MQPNGSINKLEFVYTAKTEGYTNLGSSMNELSEIVEKDEKEGTPININKLIALMECRRR